MLREVGALIIGNRCCCPIVIGFAALVTLICKIQQSMVKESDFV